MAPERNPQDWEHNSALVLDQLARLQQGQDELQAAQDTLRQEQAKDREETVKHRGEMALALQNVKNRLDTEIRVIYAKAAGFGIAIYALFTYLGPILKAIFLNTP